MSDERTTAEIDDQIMNALLELVALTITVERNESFRGQVQASVDVIKDGVAELVSRIEANDNQRFYDEGGESV